VVFGHKFLNGEVFKRVNKVVVFPIKLVLLRFVGKQFKEEIIRFDPGPFSHMLFMGFSKFLFFFTFLLARLKGVGFGFQTSEFV
jgi:hypothetical protein